MKKSTHIFKNIMAIAAITIFVACKKEIDKPMNDLNASSKVMPAAAVA
ncbi:MAG: hypothetical protein ABIO81_11150 [Ginsengibacter sp.]